MTGGSEIKLRTTTAAAQRGNLRASIEHASEQLGQRSGALRRGSGEGVEAASGCPASGCPAAVMLPVAIVLHHLFTKRY